MILFVVLTSSHCPAQDKGGLAENWTVPAVQKVLSRAHLSGSLEFWGGCDLAWPRPELTRPRPVTSPEISTIDVLQEMFANDPKMRVTQERDGTIRMAEEDVPQDLLEVKIHHLAFPSDHYGPHWSVYDILHAPEVMDFMAHKIWPARSWGGWGMPTGPLTIGGRSLHGELNDVTVAQALDYVLQRFPGFWTYQNCHDPEGRRTIFIGFYDNLPLADVSTPETK